MDAFGKLFSSVSTALEFNQATLSGCVDIIVVEQPDGTLKSTPFHTRFGKLKVLKCKDKVVKIYVNDQEASFSMKLGEAGEGFFEEKVLHKIESHQPQSTVLNLDCKRISSDDKPRNASDNTIKCEEKQKSRGLVRSLFGMFQSEKSSQGTEETLTEMNQNTNQELKEKLEMKNTLGREKTSAETKVAEDENLFNVYDEYTEVETPLDFKGIKKLNETPRINSVTDFKPRATTLQIRSTTSNEIPSTSGNLYQSAVIDSRNRNQRIKYKKVKILRPSSDKLKSLNLRSGYNSISFVVETTIQRKQTITGSIYFWPRDAKIIISDIDGTITRSDFLGHVMPMLKRDWSHPGVAPLYANIRRNGYHILYLTSRAIGQSDITRDFLHSVYQDGKMLPHGPVIMSPDCLMSSFKREIIFKRPELFKIAALKDIKSLFPADHNPFYAGFGNRETDAIAYQAVGIAPDKTFIVNPKGDIRHNCDSLVRSYALINTTIKEIFPCVPKCINRLSVPDKPMMIIGSELEDYKIEKIVQEC